MRNGANLVRLGRLERPLNALSTHSLCLIGVQTHGREQREMEDQAGFEPALGVSHGIKSPVRSAATGTGPNFRELRASSLKLEGHPASREGTKVLRSALARSRMVNPGGVEPLATGLKVPRLSSGALRSGSTFLWLTAAARRPGLSLSIVMTCTPV